MGVGVRAGVLRRRARGQVLVRARVRVGLRMMAKARPDAG